MSGPAAPAEAERVEARPGRVVVGTLLGVVAASFAILSVGDSGSVEAFGPGPGASLAGPAPAGACGQGAPAGPTYSLDVAAAPDPPRPEGTSFVLTLRRDGRPVTGAKVCLSADMPDMDHPGLTYVAREGSGGRYEARIVFGMGGAWRTSVIVAEPDRSVVSLPLAFQVMAVGPA